MHLISIFSSFSITFILFFNVQAIDRFKFHGKKYYLHQKDSYFFKAQAACAKNAQVLVTITAPREFNFLSEKLKEIGNNAEYWIGLIRFGANENDPNWHWLSNGQNPEYKNWVSGNEESTGSDRCSKFSYADNGWKHADCFVQLGGYICQDKGHDDDKEEEEEEENATTEAEKVDENTTEAEKVDENATEAEKVDENAENLEEIEETDHKPKKRFEEEEFAIHYPPPNSCQFMAPTIAVCDKIEEHRYFVKAWFKLLKQR